MKWLWMLTLIPIVLAILVPIFRPVDTVKEDDDGDDTYFRE